MIRISDKQDCCGCAACVQICPNQCISFDEDEYGFRYPSVNNNKCVDCGLCEKVCPVINQFEVHRPKLVYAALNIDKGIRIKSSSGGLFSQLAEAVINEGGVVFGVRFNTNWEAEHAYTDTSDGIAAFRGSKYMQSKIGISYIQAKEFLQSGRKVLFSGTSCQIAGLKRFLRREYDNLLTVDVVCHGVPSPLVWRSYLRETMLSLQRDAIKKNILSSQNNLLQITDISFRDKKTGWNKYGFAVYGKLIPYQAIRESICNNEKDVKELFYETSDKNLYMNVFTRNLCLRPSCYTCPAKCGKSASDITLADFWGIRNYYPKMDDDKGTSLVLINTQKGNSYYQRLKLESIQTSYEIALRENPSLEHSAKETVYVSEFWQSFRQSKFNDVHIILNRFKPPLAIRIKQICSIIIKAILPSNFILYMRFRRLR